MKNISIQIAALFCLVSLIPTVSDAQSVTFGRARTFFAYEQSFRGGVRVALGDLSDDGIPDIITAPLSGAPSNIKIFDGETRELLASFLAFDPSFIGGVSVAAGDINDDGIPDIAVAQGAGGASQVKLFDGETLDEFHTFFAFPTSFTGGISVALGDVNGDGLADIITGAGQGGAPQVKVFSGSDASLIASFFAYDVSFQGGVTVAAGDVDADGEVDIITGAGAGTGGGPLIKIFNGIDLELRYSFFAFPQGFRGGVRVAAGDINGDGAAEIVTGAGQGNTPQIKVFGVPESSSTVENLGVVKPFLNAARKESVWVAVGSGALLIGREPKPSGAPRGRAGKVFAKVTSYKVSLPFEDEDEEE